MPLPRKTSYIYVTCSKCGRKTRTRQEDLENGFPCPKCFAMVIERPGDTDSSATKQELETTQLLEELGPVELCPACSSPVRIEFEKKYLARCAICSKFFIRKKGTAIPGASEKTEATTDANAVMPPTAEQLSILESLHIGGTPSSIFEASEVILTVTSIAENAFNEYFSSFPLLPISLKAALVRKLVLSEFFPKIYFSGESLKYEELSPFIEETISDNDIKDAAKKYITDDNMNNAMTYIDNFAVFIYDKKLDPDVVRLFALKSFARNFGNRLQLTASSQIFYDSDGSAKRKTVPAASPEKLFTKNSPANAGLIKIFEENGMGSPPVIESRRPASGCLFFILLPLLAGGILSLLS